MISQFIIKIKVNSKLIKVRKILSSFASKVLLLDNFVKLLAITSETTKFFCPTRLFYARIHNLRLEDNSLSQTIGKQLLGYMV